MSKESERDLSSEQPEKGEVIRVSRLELLLSRLLTPSIYIQVTVDNEVQIPKTDEMALTLWKLGYKHFGKLIFDRQGMVIGRDIGPGVAFVDLDEGADARIFSMIPNEYKQP